MFEGISSKRAIHTAKWLHFILVGTARNACKKRKEKHSDGTSRHGAGTYTHIPQPQPKNKGGEGRAYYTGRCLLDVKEVAHVTPIGNRTSNCLA